MTTAFVQEIKESIRTVSDFPKTGILFRDITPLLLDGKKFQSCIRHFEGLVKQKADYVISIESRGFILGSALAYALGIGFVPIRKEGKLPHRKLSTSYELEYGEAVVEIHEDAVKEGSKVILVDDVLATGGTMKAATELVSQLGAKILGIFFLIELRDLKGREKLKNFEVHSLVDY
ncbi:MAG: adenine phosphoribosyltransferase [Candidatus Omnitrophica bacterium]|nr:adenine phosphoribosyltransferase [Candidatus Omnitrophota bacterium]